MTDEWRRKAACLNRNTNYWFPEQTGPNNPATQLALKICRQCPVAVECLQYAMDRPEYHGVWGGKTEEERRGMRRRPGRRILHGTNAGYQQHAHWGVPVCEPCRTAHAQYQSARRRIRERAKTRDEVGPEESHA